MAPTRKKKKPPGNPARGFATTSVVSKAKLVVDSDVDSDTPAAVDNSGENEVVQPEKAHTDHTSQRELHELTPDQLEAQLEDSELQLLVEKHGERSKKNASRQVTRLQTERRLLRSQALPLNTSRWLPEELLQLIASHVEIRTNGGLSSAADFASGAPRKAISTDDLSLQIWSLRRTLIDLGFLAYRVEQIIHVLLRDKRMLERANASSNKEGLWGIDECLVLLGSACMTDELPNYDTHRTEALERQIRKATQLLDPGTFDAPIPPSSSGITTPTESASTSSAAVETSAEHPPKALVPEIVEDADDELEPHEILSRYLDLKTRVYDRRPDLTEPTVRRGKGAKNKSTPSPVVEKADPETLKLLRRIRKIESDILFDLEEAREKWSDLRRTLIQRDVERRKLGIYHETSPTSEIAVASATHDLNSTETADDFDPEASLELGEFFASLPEQRTDNETGQNAMTVMSVDGVSVTVRDFGKWSGVGPRRVLEEACRARDPSSKVIYSLLHSASFSCRHSVTIRWSRAQDVSAETSVPGVVLRADSRNTKVEMIEISTPDSVQSEAYVSVVSLFIIFAGSPKEEKTHLRLPSVWKDLWDEFAEGRKERLAAVDRAELKEIRTIIEAVEEENRGLEQSASSPGEHEVVAVQGIDVTLTPQTGFSPVNPESLTMLWASKASSPLYDSMLKSRMTLPIWNFKSELLESIETHQVVIICGETGCGKSTQVPAYILESELSGGRHCKIYCTEPRRISAISLARRVSEELGERENDVGTSRSLVGYAIRLESQITPQTRLVYATTGIVMRMLESGNDLHEITHLVLDEVHERTIDSDFLLIVLRKLMVRRPGLKVILMSATVNAEQFWRYLNGAPVLTVPGRTFPVVTKYLEDAIEVTNYGNAKGSPEVFPDEDEDDDVDGPSNAAVKPDLSGYSVKTRNTLAQFNEYRIDYDLVTRLLETIARNQSYAEYSKAILVFLPGIAEIRALNDMLAGHPAFSHNWYVYPMHSTIATEEQERAFLVPPKGTRKIVLATNIAETGITIPDVTCVIDTGKHKEMRFDERRQLSKLLESFISRANAKQRRGRAGRVQNGLCFHLFTKSRHDNLMVEQQTPEMLRLSLQDLVLRVKICKLGSIEQTLAEALDPPLSKNIRRAIDSLVDVKALTSGEDLTPLGRQLAKLPLDVFLGKLILLGSLFSCLDAALTIAAILSSKSPFSVPMGARAQADLARLAFKKGDSDLLTVYNAYCAWRRVCRSTGNSEYQFCRKNFLSPQTLSNIEDLKAQLTTALVDAGFLSLDDEGKAALNRARFYSRQRHFVEIPPTHDINASNELVINSIIAWSFYPKLLVRDGKGWRNVANNQSVSLYPTSVNKGVGNPPKWLSFYHIMQSSNKFYNAHETSAVEDFAIALVCGEADFKMYSGVIVIDGNRLRFSLDSWKVMLALKTLRTRLREIMTQAFRSPGRALSREQQLWFDVWQRIFAQEVIKGLPVV
ncbi:hypothetical protein MMC26_005045 [Xylographa opegraphella]|nr:hypothetical protein [Xylographa opegraphella]